MLYWLIYVTKDVPRLGIAADSEFELPVINLDRHTFAEYVNIELGLNDDEWARI